MLSCEQRCGKEQLTVRRCWTLLEQRASRAAGCSSSYLWHNSENGWNADMFSTQNALFRMYSTCACRWPLRQQLLTLKSYLYKWHEHKASSAYIASIEHISHARIWFGAQYACSYVAKAERWLIWFQCCISCPDMHCCSWPYQWNEMSLPRSKGHSRSISETIKLNLQW